MYTSYWLGTSSIIESGKLLVWFKEMWSFLHKEHVTKYLQQEELKQVTSLFSDGVIIWLNAINW